MPCCQYVIIQHQQSPFSLPQYCRVNARMYNSSLRLNATLIANEKYQPFLLEISREKYSCLFSVLLIFSNQSLFLFFINCKLSSRRIKVSVCHPFYSYIDIFRLEKTRKVQVCPVHIRGLIISSC